MEKFIFATGKTIDLAVESALAELKMDRDSVSVEVVENAKPGFLGIGAVPAKVKVTYEGPAEDNAPALSSASRSHKKEKAPVKEAKKESKPEAPKAPKKEYAPATAGSIEEQIEVFLKGLLEHMGSAAVPHAYKDGDDTYRVDLVGENLGMLIGRRGDTLDAIQHLTNYAVNRGGNRRLRINVDAECYRAKREDALCQLANKVADKVVKYRRNITLEPMNAYERHIIHATLQDTPDVTTFSTGTEPNRRVVVAYSKYKTAVEE